jgi:hypothetical protein
LSPEASEELSATFSDRVEAAVAGTPDEAAASNDAEAGGAAKTARMRNDAEAKRLRVFIGSVS